MLSLSSVILISEKYFTQTLHRIFSHRHKSNAPVIIGVAGLTHGTGTTSFCIAVSNYLCSKYGFSVACAELNASGHFASMADLADDFPGSRKFTLYGIDFFPEVSIESLSGLFQESYSCYILDFGIISQAMWTEFLQCSLKYILCDLSPWKRTELNFMLDHLLQNNQYWRSSVAFLGNKGIYPHTDRLFSKRSLRLEKLPFLPDPFQITSKDFATFEKLLKGVYTTHVS